MSSDSSHDVESASIVRFLRASPVYFWNRQRVRPVRPRGFWYLCVIEVPSGPLQFSSHLLKLINYQIKPVRHSHLLFPSRPNLKIRIRVIRSICSIAFISRFTLSDQPWSFGQCMAETLLLKAKQRLGPRVFWSSLFINIKLKQEFWTSLWGTTDVGRFIDISLVCRVGIRFWACKYEF